MNSERLDLGPPTLAFHKPACFRLPGQCATPPKLFCLQRQLFTDVPFSRTFSSTFRLVSLLLGHASPLWPCCQQGDFFQSSGRSSFCPVDYLHSSPGCTEKGIYTFLPHHVLATAPLSPTPTRVSLPSAHTSYALCIFFHFSQLSLAPSYPGPRSNEVSLTLPPPQPCAEFTESRAHCSGVSVPSPTIHVTVPCLPHGPWASLRRICHISTPFPSLAYSWGLISAFSWGRAEMLQGQEIVYSLVTSSPQEGRS